MNLYNRMKLQVPSARQVATSVFGVRAPGASSPALPDIRSLFERGSLARSVVNASEDMDYALGQYGSGLNGLGGLSGFGAESQGNEIVPGVNFSQKWAWEWWQAESNWSRHVNYWNHLDDYTPPDPDLLNRVSRRWSTLTGMRRDVPEADALLNKYKALLQPLADTASKLIFRFDWTTLVTDDSTHNALSRTYKEINETLERFIREPTPTPVSVPSDDAGTSPPPAGNKPGTYSSKTEEEMLKQVLTARAKQEAAERAQEAAERAVAEAQLKEQQMQQELLQKKDAATTAGMPAWVKPVAVGAVLIGAAVLVMRRKK